ncbi:MULTISPECIES: DUF3179 domain-containing protein [Psychrilyobacter]|uniref:DUF3179 domain-containing protein n=1 Tax=Psychrilyobacter TaxID=623282 RepID=UPI001313E9F3|nr:MULTISPECIES: DUF3179 domain-containing protein [Psychrilyobacter]MCS5421511.1 DUF3179 domain-containing protein [Psychrilyobacter sp. S5]NDI77738.1 DUF3179 domain-containing protein [Psychrilyobacter piezotolerans]
MLKLCIFIFYSIITFGYSFEELNKNILSGGVPRDGIPAIGAPEYIRVEDGKKIMRDGDIVFLWEGDDFIKIIPQKILVWHEIINDKVGGREVAITYCPLTSTVIGYKISGTTMGVSGKLLNSNLVMYDRKTKSLWPQIMGVSIEGKRKGEELEQFPLVWTTWERAKKKYPDAYVLSQKTGAIRNYQRDPYGNFSDKNSYYNKGGSFFPLMAKSDRLSPKTVVRGLAGEESQAAVSWYEVKRKKIVNIDIKEIKAVLFYDEELNTVRGFSRIFEGDELKFEMTDGKIVDDVKKRVWNYKGESGKHYLDHYKGMDAFWFAWYAFYPDTAVGDSSDKFE